MDCRGGRLNRGQTAASARTRPRREARWLPTLASAILFGVILTGLLATPTLPPVAGTTQAASAAPASALLPGQQIWNHGVSSYLFGSNDSEEWSADNVQTDPYGIIQ